MPFIEHTLKLERKDRTIIRNLGNTLTTELGPALLGALVEEAEEILAVSKTIVPKRWGFLQASGRVAITKSDNSGVAVSIGYGDESGQLAPSYTYAVEQHENLNFNHADGRTAKYLERPTLDAIHGMGPRIAGRIRARLGNFAGG